MGGSDAPLWAAHGLTAADVAAEPVITTLGIAKGGTNLTTYAAGDILYASAADTLSSLAKGTANYVLWMGDDPNLPEWHDLVPGDIGAEPVITTLSATKLPTVPATKGGTGLASYTEGDLLYASAADTLTTVDVGSNPDGHFLKLNAGLPVWAAHGLGAADVSAEPSFTTLAEAKLPLVPIAKGRSGVETYTEGDIL